METLINALNEFKFEAYPQKANPKKVKLTVTAKDNKEYFITGSYVIFQDAEGEQTERYMWRLGVETNISANPTPAPAPVAAPAPAPAPAEPGDTTSPF